MAPLPYSSPSVIRISKSGRVRWVGHASHMGEDRNKYPVLIEKKLKVIGHQEDLDVGGKI
jgi:hypothetical protein